MFVLAHFGHWYVSLIYAAPVLVLGGLIAWDKFRHRDDDESAG